MTNVQKNAFCSLDDKAHVKLGVVSAKRQKAMVLYFDYQLRLPSHDYVVASKHYLIHSVYSFLTILTLSIGKKIAVIYADLSVDFIRSSNHD